MDVQHSEAKDAAARAVERLRLAESALARRRQTACGPSATARAAMQFIHDSADAGRKVTPSDIAAHVGVSTASVTTILRGLRDGGLIRFVRHPDDGRSKHVFPVDRSDDPDAADPLTATIRRLARRLPAADAATVAAFLDQVTSSVEKECR